MTDLPAGVVVSGGAAALLLLALLGGTVVGVLRTRNRARIARLDGVRLALFVVLSALPWIYVVVVDMTITLNVVGVWELAGWIVVLLVVYALLVLLPVAAVLATVVWLLARRGPAGSDRDRE
ncbi:MAG TPA: hypothetical protein VFY16_01785 [Gemmatimonadaceae bacterium]|nr:hypothetical protein [Gemmatimonadaceae bacterium]